MGVGDEKQAVKAFSKQLLQAVASIHKSGVGLSFLYRLTFMHHSMKRGYREYVPRVFPKA